MASQIEIMRAGGILRPEITLRAAQDAKLDLASACAMIMGETGGGRMIWGHDGVQTGGIYTKGGPVTRENFARFRAAQRAGKIGRQGIGDAQLTSEEFVARAEKIGGQFGPTDPYTNQLSGFIGLADRQRRNGLQDGFRSYNGSGPAAQAYGQKRMVARNTWQARLGGAAVAPVIASGADGLPDLQYGMRGDSRVASLQRFLNAYPWRPALPLLAPEGNFLDQTVDVLRRAQAQMGIKGGDGRNVGPQTKAALWRLGWRG